MIMLPESVSVIMLVVNTFEHLDIPYLIGGSMASALYGVARSTLDADLVAEIQQEQVGSLVKSLGNDFYADDEMIRDAIHHCSSFNLIHLKTMFKVDVFLRKERSFDRVQFQRKVEQMFSDNPEQKAFMATAEDIILAKLEWYRMGGELSDRQWRDILGVLKVQAGRLDLDYLSQWATELKVSDLLQQAMKESE
jgi:hypothetical protein